MYKKEIQNLKKQLDENKKATDKAIDNKDQNTLYRLFTEYDKIFKSLLLAQQKQILGR